MKPIRVLVVDDSMFMRKLIGDLVLAGPDCELAGTARNGKEAVEKNRALRPDVITMDVEMPEMNGIEAVGAIMADRPVPVIMLSSLTEEGAAATLQALEAGAFDFLQKPSGSLSLDIHKVKERLHSLILSAAESESAKRNSGVEPHAEREADGPKVSAGRVAEKRPVVPATIVKLPDGTPYGQPAESDLQLRPRAEGPSFQGAERLNRLTDEPPRSAAAVPLQRASKAKPAGFPTRTPTDRVNTASKPNGTSGLQPDIPAQQQSAEELRRLAKERRTPEDEPHLGAKAQVSSSSPEALHYRNLIAIGTSTGGPRALQAVLGGLPDNLQAPVLIVQHMPPHFTKSLANRLHATSPLVVLEAEDGMIPAKGTAYIAPGGKHMTLVRSGRSGCMIRLSEEPPRGGHRPSVDTLFESLTGFAELRRHIALLTGMGSDGAQGMLALKQSGAVTTIAEAAETCVVYGMPRSAVELQAAEEVVPLGKIAARLVERVNR